MKYFHKDNFKNYLLLLGIAFILLKISLIELDLPKWNIAFYQPIDELYYVYPAYNLFENGSLWGIDKISVFGNPWITNFVTYISLNLFGDNFYGLRISSILFALVSIWFFWKILNTITKNIWVSFFAISILCLNYSFTLSNIIVEPTIARMAVMLVTLYITQKIWLSEHVSKFKIVITSFAIISLWFFTYITNAFVVLAFVIVLFYKITILNKLNRGNLINKFVHLSILVLAGLVLSISLWYFFSKYIGDNNPFDFYDRGQHYSNRVSLNIKSILVNIITIGAGNIFLFNLSLLFGFIFGILFTSFLFIKKSLNTRILPVYIFSLAFILQCIFINDYPQRKLIIILPLLILILVNISSNEIFQINKNPKLSFSLVIVSILCTVVIFSANIFIGKCTINYFSIIFFLFILGIVCFNFYNGKFTLQSWLPILLLMFSLEIINTYNYSIANSNKNYLLVSEKLRNYNDKTFVGGWSMGFRSNNNINVYLNQYLYYGDFNQFWKKTDSLAKSNLRIDYSIGYAIDSIEFKKINFKPIKVIMHGNESIDNNDLLLYKESK